MIRGLHHVAVHTPDIDRLCRFYVDLLGFAPVEESRFHWRDNKDIDAIIDVPDSSAKTLLLRAGNLYLELFEYQQPVSATRGRLRPFDHGYTHICLDTDDIDSDFARLSVGGATFHRSPVDYGDIKTIYGKDPDGNVIELQQLANDHVFALGKSASAAA